MLSKAVQSWDYAIAKLPKTRLLEAATNLAKVVSIVRNVIPPNLQKLRYEPRSWSQLNLPKSYSVKCRELPETKQRHLDRFDCLVRHQAVFRSRREPSLAEQEAAPLTAEQLQRQG